jgi:hypothetical protein
VVGAVIALLGGGGQAANPGLEIDRLIDTMSDRLFFTVITVTDELNAYKVFGTLNARGVRLSATDLLKNYLFWVLNRRPRPSSDTPCHRSSAVFPFCSIRGCAMVVPASAAGGPMARVEDAIATFERNIETQTGRALSAWVEAVRAQGLPRHGQMVAWLKTEHQLSHAHANHVAKRALEPAEPRSGDDPVAHLFADGKEGLRPIYDRLAAEVAAFGPDVELAPKKANVSVRRRKQFALIQPSTRTRVDLGLILGRAPRGRLEPSGSFNAMFTHRVKLAAPEEIDPEVIAWLREAYDAAG